MKRLLTTLCLVLLNVHSYSQGVIPAVETVTRDDPIRESDTDFPYQLFATQNIWTFILLDTTNGRTWQVQYSVDDETPTTKWVINDTSLLLEGVTPTNGRFTLYSTDNIYTFLLLDREDGDIWQLQWSADDSSRGMVGYIPAPE